jgi:hypothetical protein
MKRSCVYDHVLVVSLSLLTLVTSAQSSRARLSVLREHFARELLQQSLPVVPIFAIVSLRWLKSRKKRKRKRKRESDLKFCIAFFLCAIICFSFFFSSSRTVRDSVMILSFSFESASSAWNCFSIRSSFASETAFFSWIARTKTRSSSSLWASS